MLGVPVNVPSKLSPFRTPVPFVRLSLPSLNVLSGPLITRYFPLVVFDLVECL